MTGVLDLEALDNLRRYCKQHAVKPLRVETQEQADKMTTMSRLLFKKKYAKKWEIGDEYYDFTPLDPTGECDRTMRL